MKHRVTSLVAVITCIVSGAPRAFAQVNAGSILVKAVDEQGGIVPGVTVTIASPVVVAGLKTDVTDARGTIRFTPLLPGTYSVKFEMTGFQTVVRENTVVNVGQTTPVDIVMKLATLTETVVVSGESPVVDTTSANVGTTLNLQVLESTPGGRDIWSLVEYKVPGLVTSRPDVGGAAAGLQAGASARGTPTSQNAQYVNGLNIGSPTSAGASPFYYDYEALQEVQVSVGDHDVAIRSAGVVLNLSTKTGTDRYMGRASLNWQGDGSQATNVDQRLSDFGFRQDAGATDILLDANFQLGGPIVRDKVRFFTSLRNWRANVGVPGFPELDKTSISTTDTSVTWQPNQKNTITGYLNAQWYAKPNRGASSTATPESTADETFYLGLYQGVWNRVFTNRSFMDARASFNDMNSYMPSKTTNQTLLDSSTGIRTRALAVDTTTIMPKLHANVNFHYYVDKALGGRHELRVGVDQTHGAPVEQILRRNDDLDLTYRSQPVPTATQVTLWNTPVTTLSGVNMTALFFQDRYSAGNLTLVGGIRFDRTEGFLPAQESGSSQWFPTQQRTFDEVGHLPLWHNVVPRLSAIYAFGEKTIVKASAGRYIYTIYTGFPNSVNPNFANNATYTWNDLNGDLTFQGGELGSLLSRSGSLITSMSQDLTAPRTDEITLGADRELIPGLRFSASATYRRERNVYTSQEVGIPANAFRPVSVVDIGRDGLANTGDEQSLVLYDQDPATLGQNRFVIANTDKLNGESKGLELTATKRFSHRWQMVAGYTLSKATTDALTLTSPNDLVNSRGVTDFDRTHMLKLTGSYMLPHDVMLSSNFRAQTGTPYARTATYRLTQGNVTVNAEPRGDNRLPGLTTVDARVAKTFKLTGARSIEVLVDAYNLTNANTAWAANPLTGRINVRQGGDASGALLNQQQFLAPVSILAPRVIRFGAAFRF